MHSIREMSVSPEVAHHQRRLWVHIGFILLTWAGVKYLLIKYPNLHGLFSLYFITPGAIIIFINTIFGLVAIRKISKLNGFKILHIAISVFLGFNFIMTVGPVIYAPIFWGQMIADKICHRR